MIIKNLGLYIALVFLSFWEYLFMEMITPLGIEREKNKKIAEDGLQRLADNYGLKIKNPIEDFNQCSYWYAYYEAGINLGFSDEKLKNKDKFMVQCIPVIQELLNKCRRKKPK